MTDQPWLAFADLPTYGIGTGCSDVPRLALAGQAVLLSPADYGRARQAIAERDSIRALLDVIADAPLRLEIMTAECDELAKRLAESEQKIAENAESWACLKMDGL